MLLNLIIITISLTASMLGSITGIGGGIIIKPVIDSLGLLDVATVSFLSGCSVLSMSIISFFRNRKLDIKVEKSRTTLIAVGSILGGVIGKSIFDIFKNTYEINIIGFYQSAILLVLTLLVLFYTLYKCSIKTYLIKNKFLTMCIGLFLGLVSSFLGIGGGPINIMFLVLFFSMDAKAATVNSIYIIMLSQSSNIIISILSNTIPNFNTDNLVFIIFGGVTGGIIGSSILKKISVKNIDKVFVAVLTVVSLICIYNVWRFVS